MAEICCEMGSKSKDSVAPPRESSPRAARRKRMEIRRFRLVPGVAEPLEGLPKRPKLDPSSQKFENTEEDDSKEFSFLLDSPPPCFPPQPPVVALDRCPSFGMLSFIGRRRNMEDAVAVHPSFCTDDVHAKLHYFGVYDGHGCSHVSKFCQDRLHQVVKQEIVKCDDKSSIGWKGVMERSFLRMDKEVTGEKGGLENMKCGCEVQPPKCDAGSTAVVSIVLPHKIVIANCGDSRAVLCRGGKAIPLSIDHKPDRPDELRRIQEAGGRVIFWDGPRVLGERGGVLAMSRAIGDSYLKPYVISEPDVTITERTNEDECLILASDGLWDVISNDTACGVARMCLNGHGKVSGSPKLQQSEDVGTDKVCSDAAMLLTKLALARNSMDNVSVVVLDLRRST